MKLKETTINDVYVIEPDVYGDHRGYFTETYNQIRWSSYGLDLYFVQDNESFSGPAGTLRGLHFQTNPKAQTKLVRVTSGAIYDVAVDIRNGSPTFGNWVGVILTADNHKQLLIPKGFAHGFCTLVPNTKVLYKVDEFYSPEHDRGIRWNDPEIGVQWPVTNPVLSDKDKQHPTLSAIDQI